MPPMTSKVPLGRPACTAQIKRWKCVSPLRRSTLPLPCAFLFSGTEVGSGPYFAIEHGSRVGAFSKRPPLQPFCPLCSNLTPSLNLPQASQLLQVFQHNLTHLHAMTKLSQAALHRGAFAELIYPEGPPLLRISMLDLIPAIDDRVWISQTNRYSSDRGRNPGLHAV